jgi:hypothetical protein
VTSSNDSRTHMAGAGGATALAFLHLLFRDATQSQDEPEIVLLGSNILGTLVIVVAFALATPREQADAVDRLVAIVAECGAAVVVLRLIERHLRLRQIVAAEASHGAGLIEGADTYERAYGRAAAAAE